MGLKEKLFCLLKRGKDTQQENQKLNKFERETSMSPLLKNALIN